MYLLIEYKETKTPEKTESGKFNIQTMNSTVKGLYKEREYLIRVVICTIKGCNHSAWINVGFRGAGKNQFLPCYFDCKTDCKVVESENFLTNHPISIRLLY